mgnify:CR=1 FL=1
MLLRNAFPRIPDEQFDLSRTVGRAVPERNVALVGKFRGVVYQVVDDLFQPRGIGADCRVGLREFEPQFDLRGHGEQLGLVDVRQQRVQRMLPETELHGVRLDLRKVEDVRYQTQQLVAVGRDQATVLLPFRFTEGDVVARQEVGEADDGVERRPDFMAHVGQERRFEPVVFAGLVAGFAQTSFDLLVGLDALADTHHAIGRAVVCLPQVYGLSLEPFPCPVAAADAVGVCLRG